MKLFCKQRFLVCRTRKINQHQALQLNNFINSNYLKLRTFTTDYEAKSCENLTKPLLCILKTFR